MTKEQLLKVAQTTPSRVTLMHLAKHSDAAIAAAARANPRFPKWG